MLDQMVEREVSRPKLLLKGASRAEKRVFWQEVIDAWQKSGQGVAVFCREWGLAQWQFKYWKKKMIESSSSKAVEFVSVPNGPLGAMAGLRVEWRDFAFELSQSDEVPLLRHVLQAIGAVR